MSTTKGPKKPKPEKRRTLEEAMAVTNKRFAKTLAKLAK